MYKPLKLFFTATLLLSICLQSIACSNESVKKEIKDKSTSCTYNDNEYICEIDVYDPQTNEVQTYRDMSVKIENCKVIYIVNDAYELDRIILKSTREVSDEDEDAQAEGDDGKIYNFYNLRTEIFD